MKLKISVLFNFEKRVATLKILSTIVLICVLNACSKENTKGCFKNSKSQIFKEVAITPFDKITVFENIALVIKEGSEFKVAIEGNPNLVENTSATIEDGRLALRSIGVCTLLKANEHVTIYVTAPNIVEIRSSTALDIKSDGVLRYPNISLLSESFNVPEATTVNGTFNVTLIAEVVKVVVNGIAFVKLRGSVNTLSVIIASGNSRIEAESLSAENVIIDHRGSNDLLINPQVAITGVIRGLGDILSYNEPETISVTELFNGRLLFVE